MSNRVVLGQDGKPLYAVEIVDDPITKAPQYNTHPSGIETIEIVRHESFLRGNILKYVLRAPYKGSELEDLKKARQYLEWEIARVEGQVY